ncbi:hypothetical protein COOONC_25705 [Cooperia oncophora]
MRMAANKCGPVITDNNNYIIDWAFEKNKPHDWKEIQLRLANTPGKIWTLRIIVLYNKEGELFSVGNVCIVEGMVL